MNIKANVTNLRAIINSARLDAVIFVILPFLEIIEYIALICPVNSDSVQRIAHNFVLTGLLILEPYNDADVVFIRDYIVMAHACQDFPSEGVIR